MTRFAVEPCATVPGRWVVRDLVRNVVARRYRGCPRPEGKAAIFVDEAEARTFAERAERELAVA